MLHGDPWAVSCFSLQHPFAKYLRSRDSCIRCSPHAGGLEFGESASLRKELEDTVSCITLHAKDVWVGATSKWLDGAYSTKHI